MVLILQHDWTTEELIAGEKVFHIHQQEAILNGLGRHGWEVVGFERNMEATKNQVRCMVMLKRRPLVVVQLVTAPDT